MYCVLVVSSAAGVNVSVVPLLLSVIEPDTELPPVETVIELGPTLATLRGTLGTTSILVLTATPVTPF